MSPTSNSQLSTSTSADVLLRERLHTLNATSSAAAAALAEQGQHATPMTFVVAPFSAFVRVYLGNKEWRRGIVGLISALFVAYEVFIRYVKLWEQQHVKTTVPPPPQS